MPPPPELPPPELPPLFDPPLRERLVLPRLGVPLERELVLRDVPDLLAPDDRLDAVDDFARDEPDLLPPLLDFDPLVVDFDAVLRDFAALLPDFAAPPREELPELLVPELFAPDELRPLVERPELLPDLLDPLRDELEPELLLSLDHLPLITRCAASATASAMIEPSLVALESMLPAARSAVSAASRPASRIFLRAAGLALIAAAAAARPAASISLLIAALASLSTELSLGRDEVEFEDLEPEELFRADLAIFRLPPLRGKDTLGPFRFPNEVRSDVSGIM